MVDGVEESDADLVGEAGDGDVGELLSGAGELEGAADGCGGLVEQGQALLGPVLLADVDGGGERAVEPAGGVADRRGADRPGALAGLALRAAEALVAGRPAGGHHVAEVVPGCLVGGVG